MEKGRLFRAKAFFFCAGIQKSQKREELNIYIKHLSFAGRYFTIDSIT